MGKKASFRTASQKRRQKKQLRRQKTGQKPGNFGGGNIVLDHWDSRKTVRANFKALGLVLDVNADIAEMQKRERKPALGEALIDDDKVRSVPLSELQGGESNGLLTEKLTEIQNAPRKEAYVPRSMPIRYQQILLRLRAKHGDDLEAMKMDHVNNTYQWSVGKLKQMFALFDRLQSM
ncbi:MAG: hypothetical protein MHM6MM_006167 [Cercozoa sp. M6MM]